MALVGSQPFVTSILIGAVWIIADLLETVAFILPILFCKTSVVREWKQYSDTDVVDVGAVNSGGR